MALDIRNQIDNLDKSLRWIKEYRSEHYSSRFLQLVECRKTLKKLLTAEQDNPGIAAFGKSQVGKSYLIGSLLKDKDKSFVVKAGDKEYDFVEKINPPSDPGGGVESTGVVSRFSSFKRSPGEQATPEVPVLVRIFTLTDIILTLADDYYNDYQNFKPVDTEELEKHCNGLYEEYAHQPAKSEGPITADDILYMKEYCSKHINNAQAFNNTRIAFFDRVALLIDQIPTNDYQKVFSLLWADNPNFNSLYTILFNTLRTFHFARKVYLPIESVLHGGVRENTIMSVQCLKQLLVNDNSIVTDVYEKDPSGQMRKIADNITKSRICAVCKEVVFKIEDSFTGSNVEYDFTDIAGDVQSRLKTEGVNMAMLKDNDLLDFPGARSRESEDINKSSSPEVLLNCFLRGKVAYLFNKYNEDLAINILLFCHHNKDNDVTFLYQLLEDWVNNYIGHTPEERQRKLIATKVSPLFYIGTMFNLDMEANELNPDRNSKTAIDTRWDSRFDNIMNKQLFHTYTVDWVRNWTREGEHFKNSYLLRDYKFSDKLYAGYKESNTDAKPEKRMLMDEKGGSGYYRSMRETFTQNKFVKDLFADPALSWDVAASQNNDGTLYILENLAVVAEQMDSAREMQFQEIASRTISRIISIMKEYYVSDDTTELLSENINKANGIFRELEFACQEHPEYFGHLLQSMQLTEAESFKEVHRIIPELGRSIHEIGKIEDYELIRKRCNYFNGCKNEAEMWSVFISVYRFKDKDEANEYLKAKNISPGKLFKGENLKRKNSAIISDDLVKLWQDNIRGVQFMNAYAGLDKMDEIVLTNLVNCVISTAESTNLVERIENEIADYVDILNTSNINEDLIADMIATKISDFVMDFGYKYLLEDQIKTSRRVAKEQNLSCYIWTEKERKEHFEEEEMTALFNDILSSSGRYTPAYEANYNTWLEYMYIAFIAHIDIPDYNREANDELKQVLESLKKV